MQCLTRREMLKMLSMLFPAAFIRCGKDDVFAAERVCVHVFNHDIAVPEPLLKRFNQIPARAESKHLFQIGMPELLTCTTPTSFLQFFQYFWPLTQEEFRRAHGQMSIEFQVAELASEEDVDKLRRHLEDNTKATRAKSLKGALLTVLNDYTKYRIADLVDLWQKSWLDEMVVFKDPTQAPYLCDFPALQKGFKRPPP